MTKEKLVKAIFEAKRFSDKAREALMELDAQQTDHYWYGTPTSAATRRASMDLTRALADLRRSN